MTGPIATIPNPSVRALIAMFALGVVVGAIVAAQIIGDSCQ